MRGLAVILLALAGVAVAQRGHYKTWSYSDPDSEEYGQYRGPKQTNCTCGTTYKSAGRIVNGRPAKPNQFPHMVAMLKGQNGRWGQFCGGTIITRRHVITAAHCTHKWDWAYDLAVMAGGHDLMNPNNQVMRFHMIQDIVNHENYDPRLILNDIAMLITETPFVYSEAVGPACLPSGPMSDKLVGEIVKVTGWGTTSFKGQSSMTLLKVNLKVVPLIECSKDLGGGLQRSQICTWRPNRDSCQGDSGGPVTWLDPETNRYTLVGLVSYGQGCATETPGVNTDVWSFIGWIQAVISRVPGSVTCAKRN